MTGRGGACQGRVQTLTRASSPHGPAQGGRQGRKPRTLAPQNLRSLESEKHACFARSSPSPPGTQAFPARCPEPALQQPELPAGLASAASVIALSLLQLNVVNGVSLSEDVKPLAGLPGLGTMNYPSTSPGPLVKHICAICGDRSSGTCAWGLTPWGVRALLALTSLALGTGAGMWGRWGGRLFPIQHSRLPSASGTAPGRTMS